MNQISKIFETFKSNLETPGGQAVFALIIFSFLFTISMNIFKKIYEKNEKES